MVTSGVRRQIVLRDLGNGLVLRRATVADTEALTAFNAEIHRQPDAEKPDEAFAAWTRDLIEHDHPTFDVSHSTVVEDTHTGAIVSSLSLISQTWSYGGIEFGVGRPELVGTHPDYRRQGLVRAQFEVIHEWSAERGAKMQAITGIPWYYRQFGYEPALSFGGGRFGYRPNVPKPKNNEAEPYRVRPATEADLPFIAHVYRQAMRRYLVICVRDEAMWQYELHGRSRRSVNRRELRVVDTVEGEPVGFLAHRTSPWRGILRATVYELKPGTSWLAVTPSVLRYLQAACEEYTAQDQREEFGAFAFWLGTAHPVYQVVHDRLPGTCQPGAWYVRVPDLPDFVRHVTPVLEQRLAGSAVVGHTGELKIGFYRDGLRLVFESGRLTGVEPWEPTIEDRGGAAFPDRTFLQLLFGYRTLEELEYAFADCWIETDQARELLKTLFPKQASNVWPVA
jgi:predicted N-acetyltransferase YhbS